MNLRAPYRREFLEYEGIWTYNYTGCPRRMVLHTQVSKQCFFPCVSITVSDVWGTGKVAPYSWTSALGGYERQTLRFRRSDWASSTHQMGWRDLEISWTWWHDMRPQCLNLSSWCRLLIHLFCLQTAMQFDGYLFELISLWHSITPFQSIELWFTKWMGWGL
jgi:hypothetical protein